MNDANELKAIRRAFSDERGALVALARMLPDLSSRP
jgi:hypothetical protein